MLGLLNFRHVFQAVVRSGSARKGPVSVMLRGLTIILAPLIIALFLPIWTVWRIGLHEVLGSPGTGFAAIVEGIRGLPNSLSSDVLACHFENLLQASALAMSGVAIWFARGERIRRNNPGFPVGRARKDGKTDNGKTGRENGTGKSNGSETENGSN
jgi:hypothetical protein